jgi:hypothetical protein
MNLLIPFNNSVWPETSWRVVQLFVPPALALAWLSKKWPLQDFPGGASMVRIFCWYVIFKAGFNIFFIDIWTQGHWYFPVSIMVCNLVVVHFLTSVVKKRPRAGAIALIFIILISANRFMDVKRNFNPAAWDFWQKRDKITHAIRQVYNGKGIVEISDGIFSYATSIPTMSGLGLALDKKAYDAKNKGEFLSIAYRRDFRALATMNHYLKIDKSLYSDQVALRKTIGDAFFFSKENLAGWNFHVILDDNDTGVTVVEFGPAR